MLDRHSGFLGLFATTALFLHAAPAQAQNPCGMQLGGPPIFCDTFDTKNPGIPSRTGDVARPRAFPFNQREQVARRGVRARRDEVPFREQRAGGRGLRRAVGLEQDAPQPRMQRQTAMASGPRSPHRSGMCRRLQVC